VKLHLGTLQLTSPEFAQGGRLPTYSSADGEGVSPPLAWSSVPAGCLSFALVAHDPDAPLTHGFDHWVVYNIPAAASALSRAVTGIGTVGPNGLGINGFCPASPPPGHGTHFYYFHLFALDRAPDLPDGLTRRELLDSIDEHIIEQARLVGCYDR
jgi:Raf kinase inhibitor-like YbhB/YbcL family protein